MTARDKTNNKKQRKIRLERITKISPKKVKAIPVTGRGGL
jgi:hypothetical protein